MKLTNKKIKRIIATDLWRNSGRLFGKNGSEKNGPVTKKEIADWKRRSYQAHMRRKISIGNQVRAARKAEAIYSFGLYRRVWGGKK